MKGIIKCAKERTSAERLLSVSKAEELSCDTSEFAHSNTNLRFGISVEHVIRDYN